jgi:hypothetical protein
MGQPIAVVFGKARLDPGAPEYQEAMWLGAQLARRGYGLATGGYAGAMEACSKGAAQAGGLVIGVTCDQIERWRDVHPNRWVQRQIRVPTLSERMLKLIALGDLWIALPGGIGTLSEISLTWSLLQTGELASGPLILVGPLWQRTFEAFRRAAANYLEAQDAALLSHAQDVAGALDLLSSAYQINSKGEEKARHG